VQTRKSFYPALRSMTRGISILSVAVGCTISANATLITPTPQNFNFVVGTPVTNQTVASFTDSNNAAVAGNFTATIAWGDGTTTPGTITGGPTFLVSGNHTYAVSGTFTVTVNISDVAPGVGTATATGTATYVATVILASPHNFNFLAGTPLTNQTVASFTDSNTAAVAGNFTATIAWGDGTTTPGTITGGPTFLVSGNHTYAVGGTFTVTVNISDVAPGIGTATATGTATFVGTVILASPHNFNFLAGTPLTSQTVASFTDSNAAAVPSNFTATINWGDGTTTPGTITGGPTFLVSGNHTYAVGGTFTVTVNISDAAPGTGTATVLDTTTSLVSPVPMMSLPALAGFALLLVGVGWVLARKGALT
jgi:hypothetical protein